MRLSSGLSGKRGLQRLVRITVAAPIFLFAVGAACDLFSGLALWRGARSSKAWALGILAFGALYLLGEAGGDWIGSRDRSSDPLWRRVLHLLMLVGFWGICGAAAWLVWSAAT